MIEDKEKKTKPPRVPALEYERRIFAVQGWIIEDVHTSLILKQIQQQRWAQSERHAKRILAEARKRWMVEEDEGLERKKSMKIAQLQYQKRSLKDEYKGTPSGLMAVATIEKMIIMLQGLNAPIKIASTDKEGNDVQKFDYSKLTEEELITLKQIHDKAASD